jgi:hypothetical protein
VILVRGIVQEEIIELFRIEPGQGEIEFQRLKVHQLQLQQFIVPVGPRGGLVHHEPESLHLSRCPFIAQDDRDFGKAQLARRFEPQVSVDHLAVASDEARNLEAEFTNARAHAIYSRIVPARVARVMDQLIDWPDLDFHGRFPLRRGL